MDALTLLAKPSLYVGALALGRHVFRGYGRHWGTTTATDFAVSTLVAAVARFAGGVVGFLAVALVINAAFTQGSDSAVLQIPTLAVLGVIGLGLWSVTAVVAFRRAPLWKRLTFACAAEAMSLGLDFLIQESSSGEVWRLNDLFLNMGRGLGGC